MTARQGEGLVLDRSTGHMRPARRLAVPEPKEAARDEPVTNGRILLLFMIMLLIPASFSVAGLALSPYRLFLLAVIVPLTMQFVQDKESPVNAVDVLIIGYILWSALALLVAHGASRIPFIGSAIIDQFGAYVIGRQLVRHAADYRCYFRYYGWALLFLLPFAILELFTRIFPIHNLINIIVTAAPIPGADVRMGKFRVQTVFPHAISFGIFCNIAAANFYYLYYATFFRKWFFVGLSAFLTFTSLSTGPLIGLSIQFGAILWDRISGGLPGRWIILGIVGLLAVGSVQIAVSGGLLGLIIEEIAFSDISGRARLEIFHYGGAEILRNPWFGIGLNDWIRPFWRKPSIDSFYIATAMRYGIPSILFFVLAVLVHAALIARATYRNDGLYHLRLGYLISLASLMIILAPTFIWGSLVSFVLSLIGAGQWLYTGERDRSPPPCDGIRSSKSSPTRSQKLAQPAKAASQRRRVPEAIQ